MNYKQKLINLHKNLVKVGEYAKAQNILFLIREMPIFKTTYETLYWYLYDDVRYYKFRD